MEEALEYNKRVDEQGDEEIEEATTQGVNGEGVVERHKGQRHGEFAVRIFRDLPYPFYLIASLFAIVVTLILSSSPFDRYFDSTLTTSIYSSYLYERVPGEYHNLPQQGP